MVLFAKFEFGEIDKSCTKLPCSLTFSDNNIQKQVKQQLLQHGIQLEEFGGDIQAVEVSALKVLDPHTGFHHFTEIVQTFHNKYIFNKKTFQVEIWKIY